MTSSEASSGFVPPVAFVAQPFAIGDVRLLDGPFKHAQQLDKSYLLHLNPDRFLHNFRLNAGLEPKAAIYGGWEARGVAGQTFGHYLSALSQMFQATGDEAIKERLDYSISELALCQRTLGTGYVAAIPDGARIWQEIEAGDVRASGFDLNGGWVPWYTLHKLFAGLRDAYLLGGNEEALTVLRGLCDWALTVTQNLSDEQWQTMLRSEHGGMNEALADVYALTGEEKYLDLARKFYHHAILDPLAQGRDELNGQHANTQIPKVIGLIRLYELTGENSYLRTAQFFWKTVVENRIYAIGGNSDREHFFPPHQTGLHLSAENAETCNTYNMLKLTQHLWNLEPTADKIDFYERALLNHILASQDPEGGDKGGFNYLSPMAPGHFKVYSRPDDAFWCCVGTGIENHAKYGENIYFHDEDTLWLNLFIASELNWREKGITLRQQTRFPDEETVSLRITCEQPTSFALKVRHPAWSQSLEVHINGQHWPGHSAPGSYATIERRWHDGDEVTLRLDMQLYTEELTATPNQQALLFGPVVLAGDLGRAGMEQIDDYVSEQLHFIHEPRPVAPVIVSNAGALSCIERVSGSDLVFRLRATRGDSHASQTIPVLPFFRAHHRRYAVYFGVYTQAEWQQELDNNEAKNRELRDREARTLDVYHPGQQQSEVDHDLQGENTRTGTSYIDNWRDATDGGWFSLQMRVDSEAPNELAVRYWGGDSGRTFDIFIEDQLLKTETLNNNHINRFFFETYALPLELTRGKEVVTLRFKSRPGDIAGGIFGARTLRSAG